MGKSNGEVASTWDFIPDENAAFIDFYCPSKIIKISSIGIGPGGEGEITITCAYVKY